MSNSVSLPRQTGACLHHLFEAQVQCTPNATAFIHNDQRVSYDELNHRANQLAHHLQQLGVAPENQVGILMDRSVQMIMAVLGVLKAGGAYVPLDPKYPVARLRYISASHARLVTRGDGAITILVDEITALTQIGRAHV